MPGRSDAAYVARLNAAEGALLIDLVDAQDRTLRTRRLAMNAPCGELANASAVIIATWVGELHPLRMGGVPLQRRKRPSRLRWEADAGFTAGLVGKQFSPGGVLEVEIAPRASRFGGRLALLGEAPRILAVDTGSAKYTRPMVQLGPNVRFVPWRMLLDLHAEASLAALVVEGSGFTSSRRDVDFDIGLGGGARAAIRAGPVAPYIGASVVGWLRKQEVQVSGISTRTGLPRYEVLLSVGLAFGVFR
jgi:hypothetical protein